MKSLSFLAAFSGMYDALKGVLRVGAMLAPAKTSSRNAKCRVSTTTTHSLLSGLRAGILVCGLLCAATLNAQTWEIGTPNAADVTATLIDGVMTIRGTERMMDWYSQGNNRPWYSVRASITTVIIEDGVTSIGSNAFDGCTYLTSVTIPNSVTGIGAYAFIGCTRLTSVTIGNNVNTIGNSAFSGCTGLTSVTIPNSLTNIGLGVFSNNTSLTAINVASENANFRSVDGVLFNRDLTILIQYPGGKQGEYIIPNSVIVYTFPAFEGCVGLTSITIPNTISFIADGLFSGCSSLKELIIEDGTNAL